MSVESPAAKFDVFFNWTDAEADQLAKQVFEKDPFHKSGRPVPPSLLSATDIVEYVEKTALISPFRANKKTLKHASYEACIGERSFIYGKRGLEEIKLTADGYLRVPANEIVFVESDVTFRLPRYIAARFNLQIKHVHRGMLLGTGPLVDPGFRGKLLVPLHNLTSEDYYIRKDDGFIWIEFTRTTYDEDRPEPYGEYPDYKNISDGTKWLHKAAFCAHRKREVPIRSSILPIVNRIERRSMKAERIAKGVRRTAYIGALALFVSFALIMLGEIYSNRNFMQSAYESGITQSEADAGLIGGVSSDLTRLAEDVNGWRAGIAEQVKSVTIRMGTLEEENSRLREVIAGLTAEKQANTTSK